MTAANRIEISPIPPQARMALEDRPQGPVDIDTIARGGHWKKPQSDGDHALEEHPTDEQSLRDFREELRKYTDSLPEGPVRGRFGSTHW